MTYSNITIENKLKDCFDEMIVYKDLQKSNFFSALSLPSFLRDWLLKRFEDESGQYDIDEMAEFINKYIPNNDMWKSIKNRIVFDNENVKMLTKISADIDIKTQEVSFTLPNFGLSHKETYIDPYVWAKCKDVLAGKETWGIVELAYRQPDESRKIKGKIQLISFTDFCPYTIDLEYFKTVRSEFTVQEWIDVILGAIDYNPDGYANEKEKFCMLLRLLPFIEKKINLIELAPKGTGKSYLYGNISKFGWLSTGGVMSRAKMFYDISKGTRGLVCNNDYVALDEIQTISFPDADEMKTILKGYMEQGKFTIGNHFDTADAGIILLGNIAQDSMDEYQSMFNELPKVFHESALLDRFHGFIKGWDLPRMKENLKIVGWALNSEYFCTIMHMLRDDVSYRAIVDQYIEGPSSADTRDTEAIKRICTGLLKLLFPNVRQVEDIKPREFQHYCLNPARKMRDIIKIQLGILDKEFKGKDVPVFKIKECYNNEFN